MVAASLLHYLHGRGWVAERVVIRVVLCLALVLLAYAVYLGVEMRDHAVTENELLAPFRWAKPMA
jgi:hypothetical protein